MLLYVLSGFWPVFLAVFRMGVSGSLVGGAQSAYCLNLECVHRVGVGKAMSIQRATDKLGQMLGPIVMGGLFAVMGIAHGLALTGLTFVLATLVFSVVAVRGEHGSGVDGPS